MSSLHSGYLPHLLNMPVNDLYQGIPPTYAGSNITKTSLLETFKKYIYIVHLLLLLKW